MAIAKLHGVASLARVPIGDVIRLHINEPLKCEYTAVRLLV
jgi:hypothetical protein